MVERVTGQDLQLRALPDTSRSFNTQGAFGEQIGEAMQQAGDVVSQFAVNWQKEKNADAVIQGDNALSEWENSYLNDKENGVYAKTGMNTDGVTKQANMDFEKQVRKLTEGMNPAAAKSFKRLVAQRRQAFNRGVARHELSEFTKYRQNNADAMIAASAERIAHNAGDEDIRQLELKRMRGAIDSTWHGQSKEFRDNKYNAARSIVNKNIVETMLARGQVSQAKAFYDRDDIEISAQDRIVLEKQLKQQTDLQTAMTVADEITTQYTDMAEANEAIKKRFAKGDPQIRQEVQRMVDNHFTRQNQQVAQARRDALQQGWDLIRNGGSTDVLPPKLRAVLNGDDLNKLQQWERMKLQGREPIQQHDSWYALNQLITRATTGDQEAFEQLRDMNIYADYRLVLDDAHFDAAVKAQQAVIQGDYNARIEASNSALNAIQTSTALNRSLESILGPRPAAKKEAARKHWDYAYQRLEQQFQGKLDAWREEHPKVKKLPAAERTRMLNELHTELHKETKWMGLINFSKDNDTLTLADVPPEDIGRITDDLVEAGIEPTPYNILQVYSER